MLKYLATNVVPGLFNLEVFLEHAEQITPINKWRCKTLDRELSNFHQIRGNLVTVSHCQTYLVSNAAVVKIDDELLAKQLYAIVTQEGFANKLNSFFSEDFAYHFHDAKFFVNKKQEKVLYIFYKYFPTSLKALVNKQILGFEKLINLLSSDERKLYIDYKYILNYANDSAHSLMAYLFVNISLNKVAFDTKTLSDIVVTLLDSDPNIPYLKKQYTKFHLPGMYSRDFDSHFSKLDYPKEILLNCVRFLINPDEFKSYDDFFCFSNESEKLETELCYSTNFVYDKALLESSLKIEFENDNFVVYKPFKRNVTVIKIKNHSLLNKFSDTITKYTGLGLLDQVVYCGFASTLGNTEYYAYFQCRDNNRTLVDYIKSISDEGIDMLVTLFPNLQKNTCPLNFNSTIELIDCFGLSHCEYQSNGNSKIVLTPKSLAMLDFNSNLEGFNVHKLLMQIIHKFVGNNIKIKELLRFNFMKRFSPKFTTNLIEYIKTGKYVWEQDEQFGEILLSVHAKKLVFVDDIQFTECNKISFMPEFVNFDFAKKILQYRKTSDTIYADTRECFEFLEKIGVTVSENTLEEVFNCNSAHPFFTPSSLIICEDVVENDKYRIVGVKWNNYCTDIVSLKSLLESDKLNTFELYDLICQYTVLPKAFIPAETDAFQQHLVNGNSTLLLNRNIVNPTASEGSQTFEESFKHVVSMFKKILKNKWFDFEHFKFKDLQNASENIRYAAEEICFCSKHNHYYLFGKLCPECQKVFEIVQANKFKSMLYSTSISSFIRYNSKGLYTKAGATTLKNVQLGLENGLYDKFFFKPCKIGVTVDTTPIGIIYEEIDFTELLPLSTFKGTQRLKVIRVLYKRLLPYILDGSFIIPNYFNNHFFESMAMHKKYSGQILILDICHMDSKAILRSNKQAEIEFTKTTFANFLVSYIIDDAMLSASASNDLSPINLLIEDIKAKKFSEEAVKKCFGAFCKIHKMPIEQSGICPLCSQEGILSTDIITKTPEYFKRLKASNVDYEGGEANLYNYSNTEIIKVFKHPVDLAFKTRIIGKAFQKASKFKAFNESHPYIKFITINKAVYSLSDNYFTLEGYTQDFVSDSFKISSLKEKDFVNKMGYTTSDILDILIKVCTGIEFLHSIGGYIGDLNGGNILIKNKIVYFIDVDGMSFDDVKNFVYTDTYIDPMSVEKKNITKDDDWYSFAIQAFYYLTYSHPFRGICDSVTVPDNEIERMKKGMSLLGNHNIKAPNISIGWQHLPSYVISFFLNTFEGKKRESMKSVLQEYKTELTCNKPSLTLQEVERKYYCKRALSYTTYISEGNSIIWNETPVLLDNYYTVCIRDDYISFSNRTGIAVLNEKTGEVKKYAFYPSANFTHDFQNNKLFIASTNNTEIYLLPSEDDVGQKPQLVQKATNNPVLCFFVTKDNKFLFVEKESKTQIAVYCNLQKLTTIDNSTANYSQFMICLDEITGKYLIWFKGQNNCLALVIDSNGKYYTFTVDGTDSASISFYKNTLYYIKNDSICCYNLASKKDVKLSYYAANGSFITCKGNKFIICNGNKTYVYLKA